MGSVPASRRAAPDVGLFGPDTVTWRVHQDPCMLAGGLRALLIQALNPRAMAAVDQHSDFRTDPWGRLARTSQYVTTTIFGTSEEAHAAAARVRTMHRRVSGIDPVTQRPYRADDPELLLWVHAVEVDSFLAAYRTYAGALSDADADRYVHEWVRAAELVGLHADDVPHTVAELRAHLDGITELCVTPAARDGLRLLLAPPAPLWGRAAWAIPATAAIAILPPRVRDLYGLPAFEPADLAVRAAVGGLTRVLRVLLPRPEPIRRALARAVGQDELAVARAGRARSTAARLADSAPLRGAPHP